MYTERAINVYINTSNRRSCQSLHEKLEQWNANQCRCVYMPEGLS